MLLMTETLTELQNTSIEALSNEETFLIVQLLSIIYISRENQKKIFWHLIDLCKFTETMDPTGKAHFSNFY